MGVRYDVVYTTKELSRVLSEPTETANDIVRRALIYIKRTKGAHLKYSSTAMHAFQIPATRKKPTDTKDNYDTTSYNIQDGIPQEDDKEHTDTHRHKGPTMYVVCQTDIDLAGQVETRQSTSALMIRIMGAMVHYLAGLHRKDCHPIDCRRRIHCPIKRKHSSKVCQKYTNVLRQWET